MKSLLPFLARVIGQRMMIAILTRQTLRARYAGTAGGFIWILIQPLVMVATYWLVFSVGFKAHGSSGEPFILFFVTGLAPWLFFNEAVVFGAGAVAGNPHLVKKMVFPTEILPLVQVLAAAVTHLLMLVITLAVMAFYQRPIGPSAVGIVYYFAALAILALGLGWLTAALQVFFRDVGQVVTVLFGFWFWLTPVVWPPSLLPPEFTRWLVLNPLNYVVQGYRDSLLYGVWPWARMTDGLIFWAETLVLVGLGATVFRRLKPDFAEVI